jgi:hypothetical protein
LLKNASRKTLIKTSVKYFTSTVPHKTLGIQNSGKISNDRSRSIVEDLSLPEP